MSERPIPILTFVIVLTVALFAPPTFGIKGYDYQNMPWSVWSFISVIIAAIAYGIAKKLDSK